MPAVSVDLGVTLLRLNRNAEGVKVLEQFIADHPEAPEVSRARELVANPASTRETGPAPVSMTMLEGETLTLSELTGKVVLLDFWGTWCPPCRAATPELVKFQKKMAANSSFVMIGVACNEKSEGAWTSYVTQNKMAWHEFLDAKRQMAMSFNVHEFPTYIVIGGDGKVRYRHAGWGKTALGSIESAVKAALTSLTSAHTPAMPALVSPPRWASDGSSEGAR
jgi:thiol-disulfide isomerase/thioredoxin